MRISILILLVSAFLMGGLSVRADELGDGSDQEPTTPVTGYAFKLNAATPTPLPSLTPTPAIPLNKAPRADAGPNQTVTTSALVVLSGSNSKDSDGTVASYAWKQLSGPKVELLSSRTAHPSFSSGKIASSYIFQLTVRDNEGASAIDVVTIAVQFKAVVTPSPSAVPTISPTPEPASSITTPFSFMNIVLVLLVVFLLVLVIIFGRVAFVD